jgi:hypothetical protein
MVHYHKCVVVRFNIRFSTFVGKFFFKLPMIKEYLMNQNILYWICNCWNPINNIGAILRNVQRADGHRPRDADHTGLGNETGKM